MRIPPLIAGFLALSWIGAPLLLDAQAPANKEAHHKTLIYTNFLRMFEVELPAGETMADHVHEFDVATLALGDATTRTRRGGQTDASASVSLATLSIAQFSGGPATALSVQNTGSTPYHVLEVENVREDGKFPVFPPMVAPGVTPVESSRGFAVYDVRLGAATPMSQHTHQRAFIIVLLDGVVENGGIGGEEPVRISRTGQWIAMPAAASHYLSAPSGEAHAIEIEVR